MHFREYLLWNYIVQSTLFVKIFSIVLEDLLLTTIITFPKIETQQFL